MDNQPGAINKERLDIRQHISDSERLAHYENIVRKLFYACEYCDGALIQLANCVVCKRAVIRKCTCCNTELRVSHSMCEVSNRFEKCSVNTSLIGVRG